MLSLVSRSKESTDGNDSDLPAQQSDTIEIFVSSPLLQIRFCTMPTVGQSKRKLKLGVCTRLLALAALFWFFMQVALVPRGKGSKQLRSTSSRRILFIHIGKTGGEWIKSQLSVICKTRKNPQIKESCLDKFQDSDASSSQLSHQTVGYLHVHSVFPRNAYVLATHYLFSVRHPLKRLVSWYIYNHPRSCDPRENNSPSCKTNDWKTHFFKCFPTLEDLGSPKILDSNDKCSAILWGGWDGRVINVKEPNHLYWNYGFYWNETQGRAPKKPILAVRQESLEQDLGDLERYLGGSAPVRWHPSDSVHFITGRAPSGMSRSATRILCCALQNELGIYESILQRAENLPSQSKGESLQDAYRVCGVETSWTELECTGFPRFD